MATNKPKATAKAKQPPQNTSAPATPDKPADVSATEAAQAASQASRPEAGKESDETKAVPPPGDVASAVTNVTAGVIAPVANEAKAPSQKKKEVVVTALIVSAKVEGFRRAGRPWSKAAQTVSIDEFTTEQVEALLGESMLEVTVVAK